MCATGEPKTTKSQQCYEWHENRIGQRTKDAERLGVPFHLTEFGACFTEGPCVQEIEQVAQIADHHLIGWAYWQYKIYGDLTTSASTGSEGFWNQDGSLQEWKVKALTRTYLKATQGVPKIQNFNTKNADFFAEINVNSQIDAPSEIYLSPEYWYPNGFDYELVDTYTDHILTGKQVTIDKSDPRAFKF